MPNGTRGGFPVFWREFGDGPDNAVFLHCALAHSKAWAQVAEALSNDLTMIAPDMPGHGRSAPWDNRCDIFDQVTAIAMDCIGDNTHLVGHSFGAVVALRVATEAPDRVKTLTLIEPVFFAAARLSDETAFKDYLTSEAAFAEALRDGDWETGAKEFTEIWGDGRAWEDLSKKERSTFASQMHFIRETEAALLRDTVGLLDAGRLEAVTCPTSLVRGSDTHPIIPAIHKGLSARLPLAVDQVVHGAGHMVPMTHPSQIARIIQRQMQES